MTNSSFPATLLEVLHAAPAGNTALLIPETGARVSYESLRRQVAQAADAFASAGIQKGDRVAMALANGPAVIVSFLAASMAGTAAPLNPAYRYEEFCFLPGRHQRARAGSARRSARRRARGAPRRSQIPILTAEMDAPEKCEFPAPAPPARPPRPGPTMSRSSCTPAAAPAGPSACRCTHRNLALSARNIVSTYELSPDDVSLCLMPLFHVHGLVASTLSTLLTGGTVVVPAKFNPLSFWRTVRDHGVTWYSAVPTIHQLLLARSAARASPPARSAALHPLVQRVAGRSKCAKSWKRCSARRCSRPTA